MCLVVSLKGKVLVVVRGRLDCEKDDDRLILMQNQNQ